MLAVRVEMKITSMREHEDQPRDDDYGRDGQSDDDLCHR
jgi:hypothetical protein